MISLLMDVKQGENWAEVLPTKTDHSFFVTFLLQIYIGLNKWYNSGENKAPDMLQTLNSLYLDME